MATPYLAEIRIVGFNFPPFGWAFCDGQILSIAQNTAVFSLVGTFYGGDGKSNFALPDFQGRVPMGQGNGPGLTPRVIGEQDGSAQVTLLSTEMPSHNHPAGCSAMLADQPSPGGFIWAVEPVGATLPYSDSKGILANMSPALIQTTGGSLPHNNLQPYLVLNFVIALQGVFPARN